VASHGYARVTQAGCVGLGVPSLAAFREQPAERVRAGDPDTDDCVAAIGPLLPLHDPLRQVLSDRLLPPGSPSHWFGTDQLGRDILARLVIGSRLTLEHRDPGRGAGRAGGFADRYNGGLLRRFRRYRPDAH
jgi:hypothetical protein